ncbi:SAM-dependent methyltransferase [Brevundimonas diminuta]|jgi:SAM-dependent methyltransferase|uniref:SAM-dependent methyltransferase n=2 Tax=Brevundimonas diminuta TaxID=293 RepID=UPI003D9A11B8
MKRDLSAELMELKRTLGEFTSEIDARIERIQSLAVDSSTAVELAEAVAYRGDDMNGLYRAFVGGEAVMTVPPAPLPFTSTLCQQLHFGLDQYRFWSRAMKEKPRFLRKQWEFVFIAQALYERGFLRHGSRGLAFGVGREPLPALFASFGCDVVATDQSLEGAIRAGWVRSSEHSADLSGLNDRHICTDRMFSELVTFAEMDMNAISRSIDGTFDFCWSACALEHLGSLEHGLRFIRNSLNVLKPGGIAVHTTEYNLSSNEDTIDNVDLCLYRRKDIERIVEEVTGAGFEVAPLDWTVGEGFAETVVDLPPYGRGEPHVRLRLGDYDCTSIGLIIRRPL